jgi:hypothetical protein
MIKTKLLHPLEKGLTYGNERRAHQSTAWDENVDPGFLLGAG